MRSLKVCLSGAVLGACLGLLSPGAMAVAQTPEAAAVPPPPSYGDPATWAAYGSLPGVSAVVPAGATPAAKAPQVDVFYVHPTTIRDATVSNQDLADAKTNAWTDGSVIARQAAVFNGCCRIFAPRYRQASFRAQGRDKALELAYGDIEQAFDYYLAHENHGRPFILAGHSQGGFQVARLVERRIQGTPLQSRMVVAYVLGMNVAEGDFPRVYKSVPICKTPRQLHCVVQWNAVLKTTDLDMAAKGSEKGFVEKYGDIPGKVTLCVNPLTFDTAKPAGSAKLSLGAVPGAPDASPVQGLRPGVISAECRRGFLVVEPDPSLNLQPLPGGSMHYHDMGLFYADIRANAALRIRTMLGSCAR